MCLLFDSALWLQIIGADRIRDFGVIPMAKGCTRLEELAIGDSYIVDNALEKMAEMVPQFLCISP